MSFNSKDDTRRMEAKDKGRAQKESENHDGNAEGKQMEGIIHTRESTLWDDDKARKCLIM